MGRRVARRDEPDALPDGCPGASHRPTRAGPRAGRGAVPVPPPGECYDARGGGKAHKARAKRLFEAHGGTDKGYVVCHGTGERMHWTDDPAENPRSYPKFEQAKIFTRDVGVAGDADHEGSYPKFEQGKIFTAFQGGGYRDANVLPENPEYNRLRGNAPIRPENLERGGGRDRVAARKLTMAEYAQLGAKPKNMTDVADRALAAPDAAATDAVKSWVAASPGWPPERPQSIINPLHGSGGSVA